MKQEKNLISTMLWNKGSGDKLVENDLLTWDEIRW